MGADFEAPFNGEFIERALQECFSPLAILRGMDFNVGSSGSLKINGSTGNSSSHSRQASLERVCIPSE